MPTFTLISAQDPFEAVVAKAEAAVRVGYIADYLTALRTGDIVTLNQITYEVELLDDANPGQLPLMDEIRGLHLPAAA